MADLIYSIYVNIDQADHDIVNEGYPGDSINKSEKTRQTFQKYYHQLVECKENYARDCNAEFVLYEDIDHYIEFSDWCKAIKPSMSKYNIINFYKFYIAEQVVEKYDNVLFLDFDVIPHTKENFFEVWDCQNNFVIATSERDFSLDFLLRTGRNIHFRSPDAKRINSVLLLNEHGYSTDIEAYNTGIMGFSLKTNSQLNYFKDFSDIINDMTNLKNDDSFPENIRNALGWDNETLFGFRSVQHDLPIQELDDKWHCIIEQRPRFKARLGHYIHKKFELHWK
tara:strand:- start:718 stop:1560 length:843 start_codon:yes stop_codon:yes gene_type:complete